MERFYVACDLGSSQCKTALFNEDGSTVALISKEYPSQYPHEGWVEQNPEDWVEACFSSIAQLLRQTRISPAAIAGVGIVGVTHNAVLLDDLAQPLAPAILLYDIRSKPQVAHLRAKWGADYIRERTLNDMTTVWTWPQLLWVKENRPDLWQRVATIIFQKDYVRSRLTTVFGRTLGTRVTGSGPTGGVAGGVTGAGAGATNASAFASNSISASANVSAHTAHAVSNLCTDIIDAEGSLLFDPVADVWIEEFYRDLGLSLHQLPQAVDPMQVVGGVSALAAARTGLREGTPVIAGTTDTVAEVLAAGGVEAGIATLKLASVGRITLTQPDPIRKPHTLNYKHILKDLWYPGTASKSAAYAFRWLKDLLYPMDTMAGVDGSGANGGTGGQSGQRDQGEVYRLMDELAAAIPVGSGGLLFHPHLMGEWAPHWNTGMKANFIGLQARHTRGNLIRAALEGVAFSLLDAFGEMAIPPAAIKELLLIGQGSRSPLWSQIIADVFNHPITVPTQMEAVYGAGIITIMGITGKPISDFYPLIRRGTHYEPQARAADTYDRLFAIYREADAALTPVYEKLDGFKENTL